MASADKQVEGIGHTNHSEKHSRRTFLAGAAGVASMTALAGCTGIMGGGGSGSETATKVSAVMVHGEGELVKRLFDNYVTSQTGIEVDTTLLPYGNLYEKVSTILSTKSKAFDIVLIDDPWFPNLSVFVDPIKQWLPKHLPEEKFINDTLNICMWPPTKGPIVPAAKGREPTLRALPAVGNCQLFAYNKKDFEQVGAKEPNTWDEVYKVGKQISEQIEGTHGYVIRGERGNPITTSFFGLGMSRAGDMFDNNWRYQWDGSEGVDTLSFYVNDLKSISPPGVATFNADGVLNHLSSGKAAQATTWPAAASLILDPEKSEEAKNLQFTPIPKGDRSAPEQGNWLLGINSAVSDAKKRAAGEVIRSFVSKEAQDEYVKLGGIPFRHDTFKNNMDKARFFPALYKSLQHAKWRPRTPLWMEMVSVMGRTLNTALVHKISPKAAQKTINDDLEKMIAEAGYYKEKK